MNVYALSAPYNNGNPYSWVIEGSNNGSTWTTVDSVSGEPAWAAGETRFFTLASPVTYSYYRFRPITNDVGGQWWRLGEWDMFENSCSATTGTACSETEVTWEKDGNSCSTVTGTYDKAHGEFMQVRDPNGVTGGPLKGYAILQCDNGTYDVINAECCDNSSAGANAACNP